MSLHLFHPDVQFNVRDLAMDKPKTGYLGGGWEESRRAEILLVAQWPKLTILTLRDKYTV